MPSIAARHAELFFITYAVQQVELCLSACHITGCLAGKVSHLFCKAPSVVSVVKSLLLIIVRYQAPCPGMGALVRGCSMAQIAVLVIGSHGHDQGLIAKNQVVEVVGCHVQLQC